MSRFAVNLAKPLLLRLAVPVGIVTVSLSPQCGTSGPTQRKRYRSRSWGAQDGFSNCRSQWFMLLLGFTATRESNSFARD